MLIQFQSIEKIGRFISITKFYTLNKHFLKWSWLLFSSHVKYCHHLVSVVVCKLLCGFFFKAFLKKIPFRSMHNVINITITVFDIKGAKKLHIILMQVFAKCSSLWVIYGHKKFLLFYFWNFAYKIFIFHPFLTCFFF